MSTTNTKIPCIFAPNSKPYGKTFGEWGEEWIKWALSIPRVDNPAADSTGKNCVQKQKGPVWFLAGTFGGSAKRKCIIPAGKAILFPIVAKECSFVEDDDLKTEQELSERVKEVMNYVMHMDVIVDTVQLQDLNKYRAHSRVFDLVFPENNVYNVKPGPTRSVTDGYWILLKPLSVGKHQIYFNAKISFQEGSKLVELARRYNKIKDTMFRTEVLYEITIEPNV